MTPFTGMLKKEKSAITLPRSKVSMKGLTLKSGGRMSSIRREEHVEDVLRGQIALEPKLMVMSTAVLSGGTLSCNTLICVAV